MSTPERLEDGFYIVGDRDGGDHSLSSFNYINVPQSERDRPLYRIISLDRLFQLFESKRNVLVAPSKWEDPFENFILNSRMGHGGGSPGQRFLNQECIFGQCWTRRAASDAMWRIYSPDKGAVRIRSTPRRLLESLAATTGAPCDEAFIGKVKYLSQAKLVRFAESALQIPDGLEVRMARTLLVKRMAFDHEQEVRLLFIGPVTMLAEARKSIHSYTVDPHDLIDQVMVDPRQSLSDFKSIRQQIHERTGFKGPVVRSLLYEPPPQMLLSLIPDSSNPTRYRRPKDDRPPPPSLPWMKGLVPLERAMWLQTRDVDSSPHAKFVPRQALVESLRSAVTRSRRKRSASDESA